MDITMIGSINQYLKRTELKQVWKLRQENKDMPKGKMTLDQWVQAQKEQTKAPSAPAKPELPEPPDIKLSCLESKVNHGKKLTSAERSYLREHSPELLERADKNARAQKSFERELKQCRTQEDVKRLKLKYVNASLSQVQSIEHNPNISQAKKLEVCLQENGKIMAVERAAAAHIRSGAYAKLPTEDEQKAAQQAEQEREEALRDHSTEKPMEPIEEETPPEKSEAVQSENPLPQEEKTKIQPETPEERKVKRARVSAYRRHMDAADVESLISMPPQRFTPDSAPSFTPVPENGTPPSSEWPFLDTKA